MNSVEASFILKNNKNTPVDSNVKWTDKILHTFLNNI